ncbi:MAG: membrane protein insertase YidC, partial [Treponema sp.]|nr:membrane protein insertase YidC [Treponema sp.]
PAPPVDQPPAVTAVETPGQSTAQELPQTPQQPAQDSVPAKSDSIEASTDTGPQTVERITIDTELLTAVFTNSGGDMVSWKLKEHYDNENYVDMIFSGDNEAHAFTVAFGGLDARPVTSLFYVNRLSEYSIEFYRDFLIPGSGGKFRLIKRYDLKPRDYMFELTVTLDGMNSEQGINFTGNAYTLSFGPQIGPSFEKLDNRYDYRQYVTFTNGKRKNVKPNEIIDTRPSWAAISGKYFAFIAIPYLAQFNISFSESPESGLSSASRFNIIRPALSASRVSDTYRFYLGPKSQEALAIYNTGRNEFNLKDTKLVEVANTRGILAPLERLLKWLLLVFYKVIPNYGVAIILLTLLVKILFFPLTKKGSEATLRMQALAPKIKELQDKYKDNRQKLNAEMAVFYQKEGYNPISGCLPMLLQIPIFFAMYNLFNNHFDLRGAEFIPGWIPDLSLPEAIWNFPEGFRLPLIGWTAIRALPFIYVGSQLIYGKVTQMPGQQSNSQMKMMLYVMPIAFFFILYNVPSGLLIYWIFSNVLTLAQQVMINRYIIAKKAQMQGEGEPVITQKNVIAPPPKKRKK